MELTPPKESRYPRIPMARFNKAINLVMSRLFRAHGYSITREQEAILRELVRGDGINQVELALRTGQERNNLSRTLTILENKNLILRETCPQDKRNCLIYITREGRAQHEGIFEAIEAYRAVLFQGLTPEEIQDVADKIIRLTGNLERYLEENPGK